MITTLSLLISICLALPIASDPPPEPARGPLLRLTRDGLDKERLFS